MSKKTKESLEIVMADARNTTLPPHHPKIPTWKWELSYDLVEYSRSGKIEMIIAFMTEYKICFDLESPL